MPEIDITEISGGIEDIPPEMADALAEGAALAVMVSEASGQVPPDWRWLLGSMRSMMDEDGDGLGIVMAATPTQALMVPAPNGPKDPLTLLLLMRAIGQIDSICWVAVAFDSYVRSAEDASGSTDDGLSPTEAFEQGLPDAREALMAICVAPDGPGFDVQQTYTRTPEGIEWDEPDPNMKNQGGRLVDLMHEVVIA